MADDQVDDELQQMTGNRKLAAEMRRNLENLRDGVAGPELAEMARDVLDGRITLRDVSRSSAYAGPLNDAIDHFQAAQAELGEKERARLINEAEKRIESDES